MNKYELLYIISSDVNEELREQTISKVRTFVETNNGTVLGLDKLGMKKFAYPINFKTEGFYVLMSFESAANVIAELNSMMNINEQIVRQMFTKK